MINDTTKKYQLWQQQSLFLMLKRNSNEWVINIKIIKKYHKIINLLKR